VGVWVCGCVGVWVCGCVGVWVCGCVGAGAHHAMFWVDPVLGSRRRLARVICMKMHVTAGHTHHRSLETMRCAAVVGMHMERHSHSLHTSALRSMRQPGSEETAYTMQTRNAGCSIPGVGLGRRSLPCNLPVAKTATTMAAPMPAPVNRSTNTPRAPPVERCVAEGAGWGAVTGCKGHMQKRGAASALTSTFTRKDKMPTGA
jgi:hypothetical protein